VRGHQAVRNLVWIEAFLYEFLTELRSGVDRSLDRRFRFFVAKRSGRPISPPGDASYTTSRDVTPVRRVAPPA